MTECGTLRNIKFVVHDDKDIELGRQVRLRLALYEQKCAEVKAFISEIKQVTVNIKQYAGTGAVTIYKNSSITVSRALNGGVAEIAESVLFELCNWHQGNFSMREHDKVKNGEITPQQAGEHIAKCEARSVYMHGCFLQKLSAANVSLTEVYGKKTVAAVKECQFDQSLVEHKTLTTPHDDKAKSPDPASLRTPEMYWYQMIEGNYHPNEFHIPIQKRAIVNIPKWFETCIELCWSHLSESDKSLMYQKIFDLAKAYQFNIKAGYELTPAMNFVAGTVNPLHSADQNLIRQYVIGKIQGAPDDLEDKMKSIGMLS